MKKCRISYSEEFFDHLAEIVSYLDERSPAAADNLRRNIKTVLDNLKLSPRQWIEVQSPIDTLTKYRRALLKYDHLLFYYLDESSNMVYVVDIIHGKRDFWHLLP